MLRLFGEAHINIVNVGGSGVIIGSAVDVRTDPAEVQAPHDIVVLKQTVGQIALLNILEERLDRKSVV